MKKGLVIFVSACCLAIASNAQELFRRQSEDGDGVIKDWYMENYTDDKEVYTLERGKKHGLCQTIGTDSTVYILGYYNYGIRVGDWQLNYPDGRTRYIETYDSLGILLKWTRYYVEKRIIIIKRTKGIESHIYANILRKEAALFELELYQCETKMLNSNGNLGRVYIQFNVPKLGYNIDWAVIKATEEYFVTTYRYPEDVLYTECLVGNNEVKSKKVYFYKGERLKKTDYYEYGALIKSETYDKEGNISKVKEY
ncbi:MAG: hypothetical protein KAJ50_06045 [Bacteroidales bacterium]|nr:hypothetical protein [Bacteroidales bacterium]